MSTKKNIRSTKEQIKRLCEYMGEHPDFAAGSFKTPFAAQQHELQWEELKATLDEAGPIRSVDQWKTCWRDQKRKARMESEAINDAKNTTGEKIEVKLELSEKSALILGTIEDQMPSGCEPEEDPIGVPEPQPKKCWDNLRTRRKFSLPAEKNSLNPLIRERLRHKRSEEREEELHKLMLAERDWLVKTAEEKYRKAKIERLSAEELLRGNRAKREAAELALAELKLQ